MIKGEGMRGIWKNLKNVRNEMQLLTKSEYMNVTKRVKNLRLKLLNKLNLMRHAPVTQELITEEKKLKLKLSKWSMVEESINRKKSRV